MGGISKYPDFIPAGSVSWTLDQIASWRGGVIDGWRHARAVFAMDFRHGLAILGRVTNSLSDCVSVSRASDALVADPEGRYWCYGPNVLAQIDGVGAFAGARRLNKCTNFNACPPSLLTPTDGASFTASVTNMVGVGDPAALFGIVDDTANLTDELRSLLAADRINGHAYMVDNTDGVDGAYVKVYGGAGTLTTKTLSSYVRKAGGAANVNIVLEGVEGVSQSATITYSRLVRSSTPRSTSERWQINVPAGTMAFFMLNQFEEGQILSAPIVTSGASGAREADDIITAFHWFDMAGLQKGASELSHLHFSHVGEGAERPIFEYSDGTADNSICAYVDATDHMALRIVVDGVEQVALSLDAPVSPGERSYAFGWSPDGGYISDGNHVVTFGTVSLPTVTQKRIGSSSASYYLNDTLCQLQAAPFLTLDEVAPWFSLKGN